MPFVLDASLALCWAFKDERSDYADAVLRSLVGEEALVPDIWPVEIANVLLVGLRHGRLVPSDRDTIVEHLLALPINVEGSDPQPVLTRVAELAHKTGLTVYDALYLGLALERSLPLATLDDKLQKAAAEFGVEMYKP